MTQVRAQVCVHPGYDEHVPVKLVRGVFTVTRTSPLTRKFTAIVVYLCKNIVLRICVIALKKVSV